MIAPKIMVVDKAGRIRAIADGIRSDHDASGEQFEAGLKGLAARVDELLKE